jgi:hypothetical protein
VPALPGSERCDAGASLGRQSVLPD